MRNSIVIKLWLSTTMVAGACLLAIGLIVPRQMEGLYDFHLSDHLLGQAQGLVQLYRPDPDEPGDRPWESQEAVIGAQIDLLTAREVAVMAAEESLPAAVYLPPEMARRLEAGEAVSFRTGLAFSSPDEHYHGPPPEGGLEYFVVAVPLEREGALSGALVLSQPVTSVAETVGQFRRIFGLTALAMLTGVTLLALYLSSRLALPLRKMDAMAQAMAAGDFRQRVEVTGGDEVARLGYSVNRLADALDATMAKLHENNARLSGILLSMSDGVMLADPGGRCTPLNRPAQALMDEAGPDAAALGVEAPLRQVLAGGPRRTEKVNLGERVYAVHLSPVPDEVGGTAGVVLVWQDITQGERLEEMRRDFIANVSHELRTPIGLVKGYAEALQDGLAESPDARDELLGIMRHELDRMEALVRDLLQLARLDAGQLGVEPEPLALGSQVSHLLSVLAPLGEQAGVALRSEIPDDLPLVLADADRLEQVLLNLLDNAIRHSPRGGAVTVGARAEAGRVTVMVSDQGPGIPPKERALVWERFYRLDRAHSRKLGGTGLGLAIVRGIVAAHGGETWVDDAPGGGSRFCFTLPLAGA